MNLDFARYAVTGTTRRLGFCLALAMAMAAAGCAVDPSVQGTSSVTQGPSPYIDAQLGTLTYRAVDLILGSAPQVGADAPLVVGSIVDANNVEQTSPLGNILADMVRTRIVQNGHTTSEVRLRTNMAFNKGAGEYMLSRNPRTLLGPSAAAVIVTGTYAVASEEVYISIKLVSATDARILSGADYVVPLRAVAGLLNHT
jgi:TolB-like protein